MAIIQTNKKKSPNRYSGQDSQPWVVKDTSGKSILKTDKGSDETFTEFVAAQAAADRYIIHTGLFAQPVRQ